jgi:hypothetical protein
MRSTLAALAAESKKSKERLGVASTKGEGEKPRR